MAKSMQLDGLLLTQSAAVRMHTAPARPLQHFCSGILHATAHTYMQYTTIRMLICMSIILLVSLNAIKQGSQTI